VYLRVLRLWLEDTTQLCLSLSRNHVRGNVPSHAVHMHRYGRVVIFASLPDRCRITHSNIVPHISCDFPFHATGMFKKYVDILSRPLIANIDRKGKISTEHRHYRPDPCQVFCSTRHPIGYPFLMEGRR
jgi:hypothetical protein